MGVFAHVRCDAEPLKDHIRGYKHTAVRFSFQISCVFTRSRLFVACNKHDSVIGSWVNICVALMHLPALIIGSECRSGMAPVREHVLRS